MNIHSCVLPALAPLVLALPSTAQGTDRAAPAEPLVPWEHHGGPFQERSTLTGDWGGSRDRWADGGIHVEGTWLQTFQDITKGGVGDDTGNTTNLDYRLTFDLQRLGVQRGAVVYLRGQSRFGDTVNGGSGLLLPVHTAGYFPYTTPIDEDVPLALTEAYGVQFFSPEFAVLAGKITTLGSANEFLGGEGYSQFMNFQFLFPAVLAQLAPYSTLGVGVLWNPDPDISVRSLLINLEDSSTTSGFDDIGDGATWWTQLDYRQGIIAEPGGGTLGLAYGFDGEFAQVGGLNLGNGAGISVDTSSTSWALYWSGWQYLYTEQPKPAWVDSENGVQDHEGVGLFAMLGLADKNANPVSWSASGGFSGRGSLPGRPDDTWAAGYFYNDLQSIGPMDSAFASSVSGVEVFYDVAITPALGLAVDAQFLQSAFNLIPDATLLGLRLNVKI